MLRTEDCGGLDVACHIQSGINQQITDLGNTLASWLGGIIKGSLNVDSQVTLFTTAMRGDFANQGFVNQFNFWLLLMASIVMSVAMVQWVIAAIAGNGARIVIVFVSLLAAFPTTYLGLLLLDVLNVVMNQATDAVMDLVIGDEEGGLPRALLAMTGLQNFYVSDDVSTNPWAVYTDANSKASLGIFGGGMSPVAAVAVIGLLLIAAVFLAIAMLVRTFGLVVLAVVAPIALMWVGQPKFKMWAIRWCEVVLGLLLAKPLAAAIIGIAVALGAGDASTAQETTAGADATVTDFWGVIASLVGLFMAAASPAVTLSLVHFASSSVSQAVGSRPSVSRAVYKAQSAAGVARGAGRMFGSLGGRGLPGAGSRGRPGRGTPGAGPSGASGPGGSGGSGSGGRSKRGPSGGDSRPPGAGTPGPTRGGPTPGAGGVGAGTSGGASTPSSGTGGQTPRRGPSGRRGSFYRRRRS